MRQIPALESSSELLLDLYRTVGNFPISQKPVLGNQIINLGNQLSELLIEASFSDASQKKELLSQADVCLQKLIFFIRFGKDLAIIPFAKYEGFSAKVLGIGKQIGGWQKWSEKTKSAKELHLFSQNLKV